MGSSLHVYILKNDKTVWSTGSNTNGQLGLGHTTDIVSFTNTNISASQISCGMHHTLILKTDGTLWACGSSQYGQLGLGITSINKTSFTKVNITDVKQVSCGMHHTFILKKDGTIWSCGYNVNGQLGLKNEVNKNTFTQVTDVTNVKKIFCGGSSTFILKNDGTIWACGQNSYGQLGINNTSNKNIFTQVNIDNVKDIVFGYTFTLLLKNDGTVWSCGNNYYGQLGLGNTTNKYIFTQIAVDNVKQITAGSNHSIILKNDGTVYMSGSNSHGQLGFSGSSTSFKLVEEVNNVELIHAADKMSYLIKNDGTVWACGYNEQGQLGLGDKTNRSAFTKLNISDVKNFNDYIENILFLISSENIIYTISNSELVQVSDSTITLSDIETYGTEFNIIENNLSVIPNKFNIICNKLININTNAIKSDKQLIVAKDDFITDIQSNIDYFKLLYQKSETANIKVIFSIDSGVTWKSYSESNFIDLDITIPLKEYSLLTEDEKLQWNTAISTILTQGISAEQLELINFNTLGIHKIRFAYVLNTTNASDIVRNKNLVWQFDSKGTMQLLNTSEYDLKVNNKNLTLTPLITTDMIKVNVIR